MPYSVTPFHLTETINTIVANANRKFKENLSNYHNPVHQHYRDAKHCSGRINDCFDEGINRLQGLNFLFLDYVKVIREIKKAQDQISEDRDIFIALLTAGKHYKDNLLTDLEQVA